MDGTGILGSSCPNPTWNGMEWVCKNPLENGSSPVHFNTSLYWRHHNWWCLSWFVHIYIYMRCSYSCKWIMVTHVHVHILMRLYCIAKGSCIKRRVQIGCVDQSLMKDILCWLIFSRWMKHAEHLDGRQPPSQPKTDQLLSTVYLSKIA